MPIRIDYNLLNAGWAEVVLSNDKECITGSVSYLHDSLGNLADVALALLTDVPAEAAVVFMDEPGEHQLLLRATATDCLHLELRWYNDWASWDMCPKTRYIVLFTTESTPKEFATTVKDTLDSIWLQYGEDGYLAKWVEHAFPYRQYTKLLRLLK